jgi:RNA polymerase sigma-70 factor, ECF subfamily
MPVSEDSAARFERLFAAHYPAIHAYAKRRCADREDAEDVTAEVFSVAWRRIAAVPHPPGDRLWLFGVARRTLANHQRSARRRSRLWLRLREQPPAAVAPGESVTAAGRALEGLRAGDRELLTLLAWDGLTVAEIAEVIGVPAPVVSRRLYRARRRFAAALEEAGGEGRPAGHPSPDHIVPREMTP